MRVPVEQRLDGVEEAADQRDDVEGQGQSQNPPLQPVGQVHELREDQSKQRVEEEIAQAPPPRRYRSMREVLPPEARRARRRRQNRIDRVDPGERVLRFLAPEAPLVAERRLYTKGVRAGSPQIAPRDGDARDGPARARPR